MSVKDPRNRRLDRRIPLGSEARIQLDGGIEEPARCIELSVTGMTLHSQYVPGEGETFDVLIPSPDENRPPLHVRLAVKRCNALDEEGLFEIGGEITEVLG